MQQRIILSCIVSMYEMHQYIIYILITIKKNVEKIIILPQNVHKKLL